MSYSNASWGRPQAASLAQARRDTAPGAGRGQAGARLEVRSAGRGAGTGPGVEEGGGRPFSGGEGF